MIDQGSAGNTESDLWPTPPHRSSTISSTISWSVILSHLPSNISSTTIYHVISSSTMSSHDLPSHNRLEHSFKFKDYSPKGDLISQTTISSFLSHNLPSLSHNLPSSISIVFRSIRKFFKIDEADYMMSLRWDISQLTILPSHNIICLTIYHLINICLTTYHHLIFCLTTYHLSLS